MSGRNAQQQINLVLLGPPGAGKGTQAVLLTKAYQLLHISTGDMLREFAKVSSEIGDKVQAYMNKGELVPDEIVTQGVIDRMNAPDAAAGVILDGFPRTRAQAGSLDSLLKKENRSLKIVLYLKTSEEVVIERLSGRRMCPECNQIYHVTNMPPKEDGVCDTCKAALVYREDDKPETVKNRLSVYKESTKDLIEYYKEKDLLREVDGGISAEELFEKIDTLFRQEGLVDDNSDG